LAAFTITAQHDYNATVKLSFSMPWRPTQTTLHLESYYTIDSRASPVLYL